MFNALSGRKAFQRSRDLDSRILERWSTITDTHSPHHLIPKRYIGILFTTYSFDF